MKQVDVEHVSTRENWGPLQMSFAKKAERINEDKVKKHLSVRRKDWKILSGCLGLVLCIYFYTIYAIHQETFLDDFDMPDELEEKKQ